MQNSQFAKALHSGRVLLLDGGLATQLEAQGEDISGVLWSAKLLQTNPQAIIAATRAFLEAGADIVETASYQASREGFAQCGIGAREADDLMRRSASLAILARDEYLRDHLGGRRAPLVAASIGPYGAILHDGSEYTGDYDLSRSALAAFHERRLNVLDTCGLDVLALETIPSRMEAEVLAGLLADCKTPAWVSFSCRDAEHLCDGTPIGDAVGCFREHPVVMAVGVNCTAPQHVPGLLGRIRAVLPGHALIAYPNSGEQYDAGNERWIGTVTPLDCAAAARDWVTAGASIVGGCCRMGPAHIAAMREALS